MYILECADGTYYIGKTLDIKKRIREHNGHLPKGAKYTRNRRPVVLRYCEEFETSGGALKREYILKQLTRKEKEVIIKEKTFH